MSIATAVTKVTSFAAMIVSVNRIHKTVADEQSATGKEYIGRKVYEKTPAGNIWEGVITQVEWNSSMGLNGDYMIYVDYTDNHAHIPGAWLDRSVLTLAE